MHFRTIPPSLPDTGGQRLPEGREPLALQKGNALNDFAPQPGTRIASDPREKLELGTSSTSSEIISFFKISGARITDSVWVVCCVNICSTSSALLVFVYTT
jgi:hypothetical protein